MKNSFSLYAFCGFAAAAASQDYKTALATGISAACILILTALTLRIPWLFAESPHRWINALFTAAVWTAAAQMIIAFVSPLEGTQLILCLMIDMSVLLIADSSVKNVAYGAVGVILIPLIVSLVRFLPFLATVAGGFILAGLLTALLRGRKHA